MDYFLTIMLISAIACGNSLAAEPGESLTLASTRKIWDQAPHNAFTDLAYWKGQFVCAFREGRKHVSSDGKIRVLTSQNGNEWNSAALVELKGYDLRDAGLSITPDGRLMLIGGAAPRKNDDESAPTGSFVSFSSDAHQWTAPKIVVEPGRWLWRVAWHDGKAYGVAYAASAGHPFTSLLCSDDGTEFRGPVPKMFGDGYPTEAVVRLRQR